jgi:hypothetical protein
MTIFAFMVLSLRAPSLAIIFIALQMVTVVTLNVVTLPHDLQLWPMQVVYLAAAAGLFGYSFYPMFTRSEGETDSDADGG